MKPSARCVLSRMVAKKAGEPIFTKSATSEFWTVERYTPPQDETEADLEKLAEELLKDLDEDGD